MMAQKKMARMAITTGLIRSRAWRCLNRFSMDLALGQRSKRTSFIEGFPRKGEEEGFESSPLARLVFQSLHQLG